MVQHIRVITADWPNTMDLDAHACDWCGKTVLYKQGRGPAWIKQRRMTLSAPFPWFGGKSRVASVVWRAFGDVYNYVEPFAGSLAVLLGRPGGAGHIETVNDLDGYIANFWRAVSREPDEVAALADWPVNEADLHARHVRLLERKTELIERLMGDPEFFDAKIAGYWVWGICCWIGSGFCSGNGSWHSVDGRLVKAGANGVKRPRVHLGNKGRGVHRKRVHLGDAGQGVHRQRVSLREWFGVLQDRLRRVRVCCGDWSRVCGPSPTSKLGLTGVFLDPPYSTDERADIYSEESFSVAHDVREWALANGDNPKLRIALCGYDGEHSMPGWRCYAWKTKGGYASQGSNGSINASKERIWFSPHCIDERMQLRLAL